MKHFVIHHPRLVDRKAHVIKRFLDLGVTDAEWVEDLNADSDFVKWVKEWTGSPLQHGHISCTVKYYWIFEQMIKRNIPNAIILEDDVVFHDMYKELWIPIGIDYVKLGKGVNFDIPLGTPITVQNYGGTEAQYFSLQFAREMMNLFTLDQTIDTVICAHLKHSGRPLLCVPVCHQTSLLEGSGITGANTNQVMNWIEFVDNWSSIPRVTWASILEGYEKKKKIDADFERDFHKKISIVNGDYLKAMTGS